MFSDQSIVSDESELQITKKHLKTDEIHKLKKRRITRDSKNKERRRKKPARAKSLSKLSAAKKLNETVLPQLDVVSCFAKTPRKKLKVPSIENAYLAKYTRLVFASIKIIPSPK